MARKAVPLLLFVVAGLLLPIQILSACSAPPVAPSGLTATSVHGYYCGIRAPACNAISLHWQDNSSDETAFDIYVSTNGGVNFYLKATVGTNVVSFFDNDPWCLANGGGCRIIGPLPVTAYYYVVARNSCGSSAGSNVASAYWPSN